jgi:TIR domain
MSDGRRGIRMFVSWAHDDKKLVSSLLRRLEPRLRIATRLRFQLWRDSDLELGQQWFPTIEQRLAQCHCGLQLLSPSFFDSDFIVEHELTPFVGPSATANGLPVGLVYLPLDGSMRMHGVEDLQVFTLDGRWYNQLTTDQQRDQFAAELTRKIIGALDPPADPWNRSA